MEDLKENKCSIVFFCDHSEQEPCVYFSGSNKDCKFFDEFCNCNSSIANVNRMTLEIKRQKGD